MESGKCQLNSGQGEGQASAMSKQLGRWQDDHELLLPRGRGKTQGDRRLYQAMYQALYPVGIVRH